MFGGWQKKINYLLSFKVFLHIVVIRCDFFFPPPMPLVVIFVPLVGALIAGLAGRFVGNLGSAIVTTFLLFTNVILSG
jgi:hypothetical protein